MFEEKDLKEGDIKELYYILPIENLASLLKNGFLSKKRSSKLEVKPKDISNEDVQERRQKKILRALPDKAKKELTIHQHVNFYLNPHNAMMFTKFDERESLCVIRVHREIFKRGDGILSTQNAATNNATFFKSAEWYLPKNKAAHLFSRQSLIPYVKSGTPEFEERKKTRQAEALFPRRVPAGFIGGIFVSNQEAKNKVVIILSKSSHKNIAVAINPSIFFTHKLNSILEEYVPLPTLNDETCKQLKLDFTHPESSSEEDGNNYNNFGITGSINPIKT